MNKNTTMTLTVSAVGNSLGLLLPKEAVQRLEVQKGDKVFLTKSPDGYRLTVYDPEFEEEMAIARQGMRKYRDALRQLAK